MNPIKNLKIARAEARISEMFPITHLNSPAIFETQSGLLGSVIALTGVPFVSNEACVLNAFTQTLHRAIASLDARFICYVTIHREKDPAHLTGDFSSAFGKRINDNYHARFKNRALFKNSLYLTVILKGDTSNRTAKSLNWLKRLLDIGSSENKALQRLEAINTLTNTTDLLLAALKDFHPTRLGDHDDESNTSALLHFLALIPNAGAHRHFQKPASMPVIGKSIPDTYLMQARYPEGHLGQYLCAKHVLFGEYIQFQGAAIDDRQYGVMLSIKQYPKETRSTSLDALLSLECAFIATHSFAPISRDVALDIIDKKRDKLINAEDKGESQINALQDLEDSIASGESCLGNHHHTLMLLAPTLPALEKSINKAVQAYAAVDHVVVVKETPSGQEPAFWAQISGNHAFIARSSPITSHNFVDFCPMHNLQTGFKDGNELGSAVTLLETPAKTPVYFNYHGKGTRTNPSNGHALILGASDAGKTTLAAFLDSQMGRYGGRSFLIDRNEATKIYVLASGNSSYTTIKPGNAQGFSMNPLQLPDSPSNRSFLKRWLAELIKKPNETDIPASIAKMINECINYNFEQLDKPYRTLSYVTQMLPMDFPRWDELRVWLKGNGLEGAGEYSWLFDNETDAMALDFDKVGFDVTYLMDEVSTLISTPVYLYIVHRMHQCLDGRLTSIIIDEAFQVFKSPFWVALLENDLPTIRKANGHFVFMTQSPETILKSPIAATLINNTKTKIILPNPGAKRAVYVDALNLTESEYQKVLKTPLESRLFLYKQDNESILCKADLTELGDEVRVFSGNKKSVDLLDSLLEKSDDVDVWLPEFLKRSAPHEKK